MIVLKNIKKCYNKKKPEELALDGVNLTVEEGEMVAVMGPSGSGKSTLLKIIGGMERSSQGEYFFNGEAVHAMNNTKLQKFIKDKVSFIFQNFALLKDYTVYENVELPLTLKRVPKKERKQRVLESLETVGIAHLKKMYPAKISGGEAQRCAIARSMAAGNELILADEPTGALDSKRGEEIVAELKKLNALGRTVIVITHNPEVAKECNRTIFLEDGKIVGDRKNEEML